MPIFQRLALALAALTLMASGPVHAADQPISRQYEVRNQDQVTGSMTVTGTRLNRRVAFEYYVNDRGPKLDLEVALDEDLLPVAARLEGLNEVRRPTRESLTLENGERRWDSNGQGGRASTAGFWRPTSVVPEMNALLAGALQAADDHSVALLPSGVAHLGAGVQARVRGAQGEKTVNLAVIEQTIGDPVLIWLDEAGDLFAAVAPNTSVIASGWSESRDQLLAAQKQVLEQRSLRLSAQLLERPTTPVLIRNVRLFDAKARTVRDDMSVLVIGDRIAQVEPSDRLTAPEGSRIIEGEGQTLIPGMWDMHVHIRDDLDGLQHLAYGVTTARDMGGNPEAILNDRRLYASGEVAGPRLLLAGLVDGKTATSAAGVIVEDAADVSRAINMFADNGYVMTKIYGSFPVDLLPEAVADAHERGLLIGGHIPNGIALDEALALGFDTVSHFNFFMLNFLGDDVKSKTNTMARMTEPARRGREIDPQSPAVQRTFATMREQGTMFDVTIGVLRGLFGDGSPGTGLLATTPEEKATYAASYEQALVLLKAAFDAGVRIVPGTDTGTGMYWIELEAWTKAGIPNLEVLRAATLGAAEAMKMDSQLGSIEPGKIADMVLVRGRPDETIRAVRDVTYTIKSGDIFEHEEIERVLGPSQGARIP